MISYSKTSLRQLFLCALLSFVPWSKSLAASSPGTNSASSGREFRDFRIISERNIFNTQRSPGRRSDQSDRREVRRAPAIEQITLLGTMSYEKGAIAFFDGSRSEYRKAVRPGESVGPYKLAAVDMKSIALVSGTNWMDLPVGKQLRREDDGPWRVVDAPLQAATSYSGSGNWRAGSSAASTVPPSRNADNGPASGTQPGGAIVVVDQEGAVDVIATPEAGHTNGAAASSSEDEVLKRLMQRREQEMNR